jgi:hypothetical protein
MRFAYILAAVLYSSSVLALDLSQSLVDLDNKPILNGQEPITLGAVISTALLTPFPDEQNLSGEEKTKRFLLALKVHQGRDAGLTADETALIKKLVAKLYGPLIVGRVWAIIDPPSMPAQK